MFIDENTFVYYVVFVTVKYTEKDKPMWREEQIFCKTRDEANAIWDECRERGIIAPYLEIEKKTVNFDKKKNCVDYALREIEVF